MAGINERDVLHQRALVLARPKTAVADTAAYLEFMVFSIRSEVYGLETVYARELFAMKHYTAVPGTPPFVLGVTSLHGEILSLLDLGRFFAQPALALTNLNKVVVVESGDLKFGLVIDEPMGIRRISIDDLQEAPFETGDSRTPYITGVCSDHVIVLNMEALLQSSRLVVGGTAASRMPTGAA